MAFRIKARIGALLIACALPATVVFGQSELRYTVQLGHHSGELTITDAGLTFTSKEQGKSARDFDWTYSKIQQLTVTPTTLTVLSYQDDKWRLGADRAYTFTASMPVNFGTAYDFLRIRLDQRLVGAVPYDLPDALWQMPVKHLTPLGGDEGSLQVNTEQILFKSVKPGRSRTWRYEDIDSISSSGPFSFTITTFERARLHYGSLKAFNFQLQERLEPSRYDDLWLRLNRSKEMTVLTVNSK